MPFLDRYMFDHLRAFDHVRVFDHLRVLNQGHGSGGVDREPRGAGGVEGGCLTIYACLTIYVSLSSGSGGQGGGGEGGVAGEGLHGSFQLRNDLKNCETTAGFSAASRVRASNSLKRV